MYITIRVERNTANLLKAIKLTSRESYDEIIMRLLKTYRDSINNKVK